MDYQLKYVATTHPDLLTLVQELNHFFALEWGEETAASYQNHHDLSKMACAVVAYVNNQPVGCGCWKLIDNETPEIKRMFVHPDYRSYGLAGKILTKLEAAIREKNYQEAVLETGASMTSAIAFYQKHGYQQIANFGEFIGDDLCVCMKKILA